MFIPEIEKQSRVVIKKFQELKLAETLKYVSANSVFYNRLFKEHDIVPSKIKTLEDLTGLPVTTKDDLQKFSQDFICVPRNKIIDYVTTSGTLGDPVTFVLTENDLQRLAYNEYLSFTTANNNSVDVFQLMTTIDRQFMAGLAYFLGARKLGSGIIRVGPGIPELQWDSIRRINPSVSITVPSFLLKLVDYAQNNGIDIEIVQLKRQFA